MIIKLLYVFVGGGIGSCLRYGLSLLIPYTSAPAFPFATFLANLIASFILGLATGLALKNNINESAQLLIMVGLCGGFSTFSTFSKELYFLLEKNAYIMGLAYAIISTITCVALIFIGIWLIKNVV